MVFSIITIILSIIAYFNSWWFIGVIVCLVLSITEYIVEISVTQGAIFSNGVLTATAIILFIIAFIMGIIAIVIGVGQVSGGTASGTGSNPHSLVETINLLI